jgi:putative DNA primase/helicase
MMPRDVNLCIKHFKEFHKQLWIGHPKGYYPWFFRCEPNNKNPMQGLSWKSRQALGTGNMCIQAIKAGWNIGIAARDWDALVIIDIDNSQLLNQQVTNTLVNISRKRCGCHAFCWAGDDKVKMNLATDDGEMRCINEYVLAPGSYVPVIEKDLKNLTSEAQSDPLLGYYTVRDFNPPRTITFDDLPEFYKKQYYKNLEAEKERKNRPKVAWKKIKAGPRYDALYNMKMCDIVGDIPFTKRTAHPLHESDTGKNFSLTKDGSLGLCWRHMVSLNALQFLAVKNGLAQCQDAGTPFKTKKRN